MKLGEDLPWLGDISIAYSKSYPAVSHIFWRLLASRFLRFLCFAHPFSFARANLGARLNFQPFAWLHFCNRFAPLERQIRAANVENCDIAPPRKRSRLSIFFLLPLASIWVPMWKV